MKPGSASENDDKQISQVHLPCLLTGVLIMLGGTVYPYLFTRTDGRVDHGLATAIFWTMSVSIVRGVGYVPDRLLWRWMFSAWSCLAGLFFTALILLFK